MNPFLTAGYEGPALFCNRKSETAKVIEAVKSGRNITIFSPRRFGKTGLIFNAFHYLNKEKIQTHYLDIYSTEDLSQFIKVFSDKVLGNEGGMETFMKKAMGALGRVRPQFTFNNLTGLPEMQLNLQSLDEKKATLNDIFNYLEQQKTPVIIAIDEFQQIYNYPEKNTEAILRTIIQQLKNVRFIFSGSQKHILLPMFYDAKRPFYQSTDFLHLEKLERKDYASFIKRNFKKGGKVIDKQAIDFILDWTKTHTFYTQYLCNRCFSKDGENVEVADVKNVILELFAERETIFINYRNLLTSQQYNLLKAIAMEDVVTEPTGKYFIRTYDLNSPATVRKSLQALLDKELIYETIIEEKKVYQVYDVFLSRWIQHKYLF